MPSLLHLTQPLAFASAMVELQLVRSSIPRPASKLKDLAYGVSPFLLSRTPPKATNNSACLTLGKSRRCRFYVLSAFLALLLLVLIAYQIVVVSPPWFLVRLNEAPSFPVLDFLERRQLNGTLLAFAEVDLAEPEERRQINKILDGTWQRPAYNKYAFLRERIDERSVGDHYNDRFLGRRRPFRAERLPVQLTSPRYSAYWPQFRRFLQSWVQNKRHEPRIMNQLLHLVKDPVDKHYLNSGNTTVELGNPYKTCAVVGNSGILLNQSYAALIDSHDMVMRLNNARITGFEQFVGSKTTLSFVNSNILHLCTRRNGCFCHPYGAGVPMILYICQVVHFMDVALCGASHKAPVIVTDPRFDTLCARIVKYYSLQSFTNTTGRRPEQWSDAHDGPLFHYSSGMQAVLLTVGMCERVSIFGFGKSAAAKHHYHTNQKAELHLHDYTAEYQLYTDLAAGKFHLIPFLNEAGFSIPPVDIYW